MKGKQSAQDFIEKFLPLKDIQFFLKINFLILCSASQHGLGTTGRMGQPGLEIEIVFKKKKRATKY